MRKFLIPLVVLLVILGLVVTGIVVSGGADDSEKDLEAGSVASERATDALVGRSADVRVPWGRLQVTVSEPLESTADGKEAGDGLSWIGVQAQLRGPEDLLVTNSLPNTPLTDPEFTLVVGEEEYALTDLTGWVGDGEINEVARREYVAVAGDPDDYELRVGYDDVEQTIAGATGEVEHGDAEALYSLDPTSGSQPCGDPLWSPGASDIGDRVTQCLINSATTTPYVAGLGWAVEGTRWLVVTVQPGTPTQFKGPGGTYRVTDATPTFLLDGKAPAETYARNDALPEGFDPDPSDPQVAVFEVADDRAQGSGSFEVRLNLTGRAEPVKSPGKKKPKQPSAKQYKALVALGAFL